MKPNINQNWLVTQTTNDREHVKKILLEKFGKHNLLRLIYLKLHDYNDLTIIRKYEDLFIEQVAFQMQVLEDLRFNRGWSEVQSCRIIYNSLSEQRRMPKRLKVAILQHAAANLNIEAPLIV